MVLSKKSPAFLRDFYFIKATIHKSLKKFVPELSVYFNYS